MKLGVVAMTNLQVGDFNKYKLDQATQLKGINELIVELQKKLKDAEEREKALIERESHGNRREPNVKIGE